MKKQFVTILLSCVLESHCGPSFQHGGRGDPFFAEVSSMDFRFPFGEKLQEVDPITITERDVNVLATEDGDSDYFQGRKSAEFRRKQFRPAWFDIGDFGAGGKAKDRFKKERKTKKRLKKFQEDQPKETEKSLIIFATPVPLKSNRRKYLRKYSTTRKSVTTTPKYEEVTLKGWETPFDIYENDFQFSDWGPWSDTDFYKHARKPEQISHQKANPTDFVDDMVNYPAGKRKPKRKEKTKHTEHSIQTENSFHSNIWSTNRKVGVTKKELKKHKSHTFDKKHRGSPSLGKLCEKTKSRDVLALCRTKNLKTDKKLKNVEKKYPQTEEKEVTTESATEKLISVQDIFESKKTKTEPKHLYFEEDSFRRREAKSSFLDRIASSVASILSRRHPSKKGWKKARKHQRKHHWGERLLRKRTTL